MCLSYRMGGCSDESASVALEISGVGKGHSGGTEKESSRPEATTPCLQVFSL
jgi:hypothetical protein